MPNKASAKKALRQDAKRGERNKIAKRNMEHAVKTTRKAVAAGKKAEASKSLLLAQKLLDKATKKHLIKKNNASRTKSRLSKAINKLK
ncbi:30S ribosomal protein S20 [Candidatus Uhrbacteria bacterium]|jgi:small subunit ribosomal protein S20|nr:30S ribosomal protein S20 [Candidatus Uhrbacteria bacterium]HJN85418.1 30S ribosomal protein S20 [Patescibacteria group bacterium]